MLNREHESVTKFVNVHQPSNDDSQFHNNQWLGLLVVVVVLSGRFQLAPNHTMHNKIPCPKDTSLQKELTRLIICRLLDGYHLRE